MTRLPSTLLLLALLLPSLPARADCIDGRPRTIGHRGTGNSSLDNPYPENTVPSLLAAVEEGATMVEIDVQLSADGIPVLMHDLHVDATTDGTGCVSEHTVAELQALDAGFGTPMQGMGVVVPTLAEVLAATTIDLDVELKVGGSGCPTVSDAELVSAVLDVLDADPSPRGILVSSFDFPLAQEVRSQDPSIAVGQIAVTSASAVAAAEAGFDALVLTEGSLDAAAVTMASEAGLELLAWTVDGSTRMAELFALDVDGIVTNEPDVMEQVRAEQCPSAADDTGGSSGDEGESTDGSDAAGTDSTGALPLGTTGESSPEADGDSAGEGCGCRGAAPPRPIGALALGLLLVGSLRRRRARVSPRPCRRW